MKSNIKYVRAREILSAGDFPTIEVNLVLENGSEGKASVPFGTSSGKYEAVTLVDNDRSRYAGMGMLKAVEAVNKTIAPKVIGMNALEQRNIDSKLISLDPSPRKEKLGGNSILGVSLAVARAASNFSNKELYTHIGDAFNLKSPIKKLPKPMMVVIEGGKHAGGATDFQEYLIAVIASKKIKDCVRIGSEIYHKLGDILEEKGHDVNVGLEGAYAATGVSSNKKPLEYIKQAVLASGYELGKDVNIAIDPAASEFFESGLYNLKLEKKKLKKEELIKYYSEIVKKFNVFSIEDGMAEDDWDSWKLLKNILDPNILVMGDDLTVTRKSRLIKAIKLDAINSLIIKPNQVGTLSETMETISLAKEKGLKIVVSHRGGGETTDTFIIDLAVATLADFVKVGPSRGERVEKYNRLMEIGEELGL